MSTNERKDRHVITPEKSAPASTAATMAVATKNGTPFNESTNEETHQTKRQWYRMKGFLETNKSVIGRSIVSIYFSIMWLWSLSQHRTNIFRFFAYLTNWGWTLELIYFLYSLYNDITAQYLEVGEHSSRIGDGKQRSILERKLKQQLLAEVVFVAQIVIVLFYWVVVFPRANADFPHFWWNIQFHGMGLLLILLDYAYRNVRGFSLRNHKYIIMFGIIYLGCHMAVVVYSGVPIYPGINFQDVRSFVITMAALSTLVFTHKLAYVYVHWKQIKTEVKSALQIVHVVLLRSDSFDVSPMHFLLNKLTNIKMRRLRTISQVSIFQEKNAKEKRELANQVQSPILKRHGSF